MSILENILKNNRPSIRHAVSQDSAALALNAEDSKELAVQVLKERQRADEKEEEVLRMRVQMTKLEDMLEQQAQINQLDAEHLCQLELALTQARSQKGSASDAEVETLKSALSTERDSAALKEEELVGMRTLVSRLEETIEQQSKVAELNKEQQAVIVNLVQALNEEKQKSEQIAKTDESAVAQLQEKLQTLQAQLAEASDRQDSNASADLLEAKLEQANRRMQELESEVEEKNSKVATLQDEVTRLEADSTAALSTISEYQRQVSTRSAASEGSEAQLVALGQQLEEMESDYKDLMREMKSREAHVAGLQAQLACEESKRKAAERVICAAENEIRYLKDQQGAKAGKPTSNPASPERRARLTRTESHKTRDELSKAQDQLRRELALRQQAQEMIAAKESEVRDMKRKLVEEEDEHLLVKEQAAKMQGEVNELQRRLAEELAERQQVQTKILEKERKAAEQQKGNENPALRATMKQMLDKDSQICELQQELSGELSKRQLVQSKALDMEEQLCLLQQQLAAELGRRVEAEGKVADKDTQLKAMRKQFAQELLTSVEKSSTSFIGKLEDSVAMCKENSWDSLMGRPMSVHAPAGGWVRQHTAPPDTGSSADDSSCRPGVQAFIQDAEMKVQKLNTASTFGLSSPQRSPLLGDRDVLGESLTPDGGSWSFATSLPRPTTLDASASYGPLIAPAQRSLVSVYAQRPSHSASHAPPAMTAAPPAAPTTSSKSFAPAPAGPPQQPGPQVAAVRPMATACCAGAGSTNVSPGTAHPPVPPSAAAAKRAAAGGRESDVTATVVQFTAQSPTAAAMTRVLRAAGSKQ
mmetsp:Transcript_27642/g.64350  ORF Transcript_27642/g.64350 Transcript_27642/m.64350 type:complete len:819 (-) Transcript_27642:130-2586(-)|eukprot:CAMPEP_0178413438 /NCGR_PEP_ID=MMETSP0689_2-20121128/22527_1 /TAXON_ID=160604 /ORGANISM="Amphidinium massartii, Strain CS-259" /LENGTH=818 /DNA_ID=CAMNT_0020034709 /DNA_START=89 /DNA_END=2545 /DNA_ORIENTATION=+